MSTPNMSGPQGQGGQSWMGYPPHGQPTPPPPAPSAMAQSASPDEALLQTRPMGLKVHYTFEKDQNYMARWPQTLPIQTLPVDERTSIGIIELRICLQAIADSSPELINQFDKDFAVYALDYSEEDTPLVGQGMLSWGLEVPNPNDDVKFVSGRVTKNAFAALRGGVAENLEVRLKLNAVTRMQRPQTSHTNADTRGGYQNAPTPTPTPTDGNSEWSSFVQANPNLGRPQNGTSMQSPGLPPVRYGSPMQAPSPGPGLIPETRPDMYAPQPSAPTPPPTGGMAMTQNATVSSFWPPVPSSQGPAPPEDAPEPSKVDEAQPTAKPGRPKAKRNSSKAPKKKTSTAARGRPSKRRSETGNTSAVEEGTDAEEAPADGPKKKRAKTTKADWPNKAAPLNSAPGSLRVAASTSGSIRTLRPPAAAGGSGSAASHLQEVPRAPTPVPQSRPRGRPPGSGKQQARRSSMMEVDTGPRFVVSETGIPGPSGQDAHSPSELAAHSPLQAYTPEGESPADLGSSPPVPRSGRTCRSSPPPSSPALPPMPIPQPDSGFMSGGFDEMVDETELQLPVSMPFSRPSHIPQPNVPGRPKLAPKPKQLPRPYVPPMPYMVPMPFSGGLPHPPPSASLRPGSRGLSEPASNGPEIEFQQICPGPEELLPKQSIYAPSASARAQMKSSRAGATGTTRIAARQLNRSNTEPPRRQEPHGIPIGPPPMPQPMYRPMPQPMPQPPAEPDTSNIDPELLQPSTEPQRTEMKIQQPPELPELPQPEPKESQASQHEAPSQPPPPEESRAVQSQSEQPQPDVLQPDASQPEVSQAEVSQAEPIPQQTSTCPNLAAEQTQEPSPVAAETPVDPEEHLLRLLSEPMEVTQEAQPELPPMTAAHLHSEVIGSGPMPAVAGNDPELAARPKTADDGSPSDDAQKASEKTAAVWSKNISRKKSIREKLEKAVKKGEMPTFCSNCGSISTPTWRKIWTQDSDGSPDIPEYSDKPGCITAIIILERDLNGKPIKYRVAKKVLGQDEDSKEWMESILCNPCGLWISKYHTQRPESRWESDFNKLSRSRRTRPSEKLAGTKKGRSQSTAPANPTSEAYLTTDPIGPDELGPSPATEDDEVLLLRGAASQPPSRERGARSHTAGPGDSFGYSDHQGSTHSRASGTAETPVALEETDLGKTRRILFPSPKRDGQPKVLGEVSVNIVRTSVTIEPANKESSDKERSVADADDVEMNLLSTPKIGATDQLHDLFGTPCRPTTPPRKERPAGPFKTPSRPTPSHRPITRSVSKSIRGTERSAVKSPGHVLLRAQQTPTKTPRSSARLHNNNNGAQHVQSHFVVDSDLGNMSAEFGTPFSSTLHQLLSEANDFTAGSSAHGLVDFDLPMNSDTGLSTHMDALDFGSFLNTDAVMPSSPPLMGGRSGDGGDMISFETADLDFEQAWEAFSAGDMNMDVIDETEDK